MIVGIAVSIVIRTMDSMPFRPRSRTRVNPPVFRSRWNRSESRCIWSNVSSANRRTACMATAAKSASRTCVSNAITMRVAPYIKVSSTGALISQNVIDPARTSGASASVAHLNV